MKGSRVKKQVEWWKAGRQDDGQKWEGTRNSRAQEEPKETEKKWGKARRKKRSKGRKAVATTKGSQAGGARRKTEKKVKRVMCELALPPFRKTRAPASVFLSWPILDAGLASLSVFVLLARLLALVDAGVARLPAVMPKAEARVTYA